MKRYLFFVFGCFLIFKANSQDIHFSQFYEASQSVNPALTGYFIGDHRLTVNYRDQWRAVGSPYKTYAFSYDGGYNKTTNDQGFIAAGLMFYNDKAGDLNLSTTQVLLNSAYHLKITRFQTIGAGIQVGYGQKSIDPTNMQWDNQYDVNLGGFNPNLPSRETTTFNNVGYLDAGFGMLYTFRTRETNMSSNDGVRFDVGFSLMHLNSPKLKFDDKLSEGKVPMRLSLHTRGILGIPNTKTSVCPMFLFYNQKQMREIYLGGMLRQTLREHARYTGYINDAFFSLGGFFRFGDAFVLMSQFEMNDFAIGFSYDFNVSKLRMATNGRGGLELSLRYVFASATQKSRY